MKTLRRPIRSVSVLAVIALAACNGAAPELGPAGPSLPGANAASGGGVTGLNTAPKLVLTTSPAWQQGDPYPVITGGAPLPVQFNLCRSSDLDAGDSLNWQFNFGDGKKASDGPEVDHVCRTEHVYSAPGIYVATLSVTDKHLEDQDAFGAQARGTVRVTINVLSNEPPSVPVVPAPAIPANEAPVIYFSAVNCPNPAPAAHSSGVGLNQAPAEFNTFAATDADGDSMSWTATHTCAQPGNGLWDGTQVVAKLSGSLPAAATCGALSSSAVVRFATGANAETCSFTFTVSDSKGASDSMTRTMTIQ